MPPTDATCIIRRFVRAAMHGLQWDVISRGTRAPSSTSVGVQPRTERGQLGRETPRLEMPTKLNGGPLELQCCYPTRTARSRVFT